MGTYVFTGSVQKIVVGQSGRFDIVAYGAQGGNDTDFSNATLLSGGLGAETGGYFNLAAGEHLKIIVGGAGDSRGVGGAGGGGGSFVLGSTDGGATYQLLLASGGGGGGGFRAVGRGGYSASNGSGNGLGGAGGNYSSDNGGGGAGFKSGGNNGNGTLSGSGAASYASAGAGYNGAGNGGFGGGGGAGFNGGGGGGGYTGGRGGYGSGKFNVTNSGGYGGTSFDAGTAIAAQTIAAVHSGNGSVIVTPVCFTTGTLIRTLRGDVAVEELQLIDRVVTACGRLRSISWIGHRQLGNGCDLLCHDQQPIRVRKSAFGLGLPTRDLRLSPGHPVLIGADADYEGGVLVPIMCLINGTSIAREKATSVTYWHVELDVHDILLAEGLPAESYFDGGDRAFFEKGSNQVLHNPDLAFPDRVGRCRPVALDGPLVDAERARHDAVFVAELNRHSDWDGADV